MLTGTGNGVRIPQQLQLPADTVECLNHPAETRILDIMSLSVVDPRMPIADKSGSSLRWTIPLSGIRKGLDN
ncbi:MAG: hypothetical protein WCO06_06225 [Candidatus Roizmanbacteria bacterium]